ncbi:MAG: AMP-binding protein, partial [Acidimicrobiales bacterium]
MSAWNFADVWEVVAQVLPEATALAHGERRETWSELDSRADGLAATFLELGASHQDKVAHYLYNCPEYLESMFAIFKAGLAPVNTNYRYGPEELVYLWDNADATVVLFHGEFTENIESIRSKLPGVHSWVWVNDGRNDCPPWATPYETAAALQAKRVYPSWGRSPDDLYILYTGGTTGYPKGVMWRQDDLFASLNSASLLPFPDEGGAGGVRAALKGPGMVHLPACPLMHGTGALTSFNALSTGGSVVTLTGHSFDATELLDTVERERVNSLAIVGDAFAKPVLRALDENPGKWDISSLVMIVSSGVMWSEESKAGLHRHHEGMLLVDTFSSSEALGMGTSVSSPGAEAHTAFFRLGE